MKFLVHERFTIESPVEEVPCYTGRAQLLEKRLQFFGFERVCGDVCEMIRVRLRAEAAGKVAPVGGFDANFLREIGEDPAAPKSPVVEDSGGAEYFLNP
jgi:hypothetical protein